MRRRPSGRPRSLALHDHSADGPEVTRWSYDEAVERIRRRVLEAVPEGSRVLVVSDGDDRLLDLRDRQASHFPRSDDGYHAGHNPTDAAAAISQLEELRAAGAEYLVIPCTAFWWLDHYAGWHRYLVDRFRIATEPDHDCLIVDLSQARDAVPRSAALLGAASLPHSGEPGLVSVVIPCSNHAHYLGEAIESVVVQTYPGFEILVVDDGSTDDTAKVAERFSEVRLVRQEDAGVAVARNAGFRASTGAYLVFLDADDRLAPEALATGLQTLYFRPDCAFVSGRYRFISEAGDLIEEHPPDVIGADHFEALLRVNYIGHGGTVMYRRAAVEVMNGFDPSFTACEEYDLYLRIARLFPVTPHFRVVADYRRHASKTSQDPALMLRTSLRALLWQRDAVCGSSSREAAWQAGLARCAEDYGAPFVDGVLAGELPRPDQETLAMLAQHFPIGYGRLESVGLAARASPVPDPTSVPTRGECS
jgi:hypothetical protein